jgi:predicted site-specific integrase-resolvase
MEAIQRRGEPLKQFCASLGFSYDTGLRAIRAGTLRTIRVGKRIIVPAAEIERVSAEGLGFRSKAQKPK